MLNIIYTNIFTRTLFKNYIDIIREKMVFYKKNLDKNPTDGFDTRGKKV